HLPPRPHHRTRHPGGIGREGRGAERTAAFGEIEIKSRTTTLPAAALSPPPAVAIPVARVLPARHGDAPRHVVVLRVPRPPLAATAAAPERRAARRHGVVVVLAAEHGGHGGVRRRPHGAAGELVRRHASRAGQRAGLRHAAGIPPAASLVTPAPRRVPVGGVVAGGPPTGSERGCTAAAAAAPATDAAVVAVAAERAAGVRGPRHGG
ncbi:unnamed protein product, partial [Ectocarpus fasciculatus]